MFYKTIKWCRTSELSHHWPNSPTFRFTLGSYQGAGTLHEGDAHAWGHAVLAVGRGRCPGKPTDMGHLGRNPPAAPWGALRMGQEMPDGARRWVLPASLKAPRALPAARPAKKQKQLIFWKPARPFQWHLWDGICWDGTSPHAAVTPPPQPAATQCPQGEALPPGAVPVALPVALPQPPGSVRALNTEPARSPPSPHRLLLTGPRLASPRLSRPRFPSPRCRWVGAEMAAGWGGSGVAGAAGHVPGPEAAQPHRRGGKVGSSAGRGREGPHRTPTGPSAPASPQSRQEWGSCEPR